MQNRNVLVIAPHPDDEVLGCGGVIARHVSQGDTVCVLIVTRGDESLFSDELIEQGRRELVTAHALLGVKETFFLDFPAPKLDTLPEHIVADAIRRVFNKLQPSTLYLPYRGDIHRDHKVVFDASMVAARPVTGCSVKTILCYETLSETDWAYPFNGDTFAPTVFVDITHFLETKIEAMSCYASQLKEPPSARSLDSLRALARVRGGAAGLEMAEAFLLVRTIIPNTLGAF